MPIEFVIRIEANYNPSLWKALYNLIFDKIRDIPYFFSLHDAGDYIIEEFEQSKNELLKEFRSKVK